MFLLFGIKSQELAFGNMIWCSLEQNGNMKVKEESSCRAKVLIKRRSVLNWRKKLVIESNSLLSMHVCTYPVTCLCFPALWVSYMYATLPMQYKKSTMYAKYVIHFHLSWCIVLKLSPRLLLRDCKKKGILYILRTKHTLNTKG